MSLIVIHSCSTGRYWHDGHASYSVRKQRAI